MSAAPSLFPSIVGMSVEKLFGQYTYELFPKDSERHNPLLLLYGDNGSGKSTLSQLLFHALSRENGRGHRTFLARTKFRSFTIYFSTKASLRVERSESEIEGPFTLVAKSGTGEFLRVDVTVSEDGAVKAKDLSDKDLANILNHCIPDELAVYFLSDNRVLQSDEFDDTPSEEWISHQGRIVTRHMGDSVERMLVPSRTRDLTVGPSVWRAETWLRRQAIDASNEGELTTSTIYTDIIRRISQTPNDPTQNENESQLPNVLTRLLQLADRSKKFSAFGLTQPVAMEQLAPQITNVVRDRQDLLASVLEPYVNSIQSRLDAFATLQKRLSVFLDIMNNFYRRKHVCITVSNGIEVFDDNGDRLELGLLSSGEKQLMLLLCNILCATTQPSIFIIDEPELSLNVKWQRELVESLLSLCAESNVQFVMATHSIELLTRNKDAILTLNDIKANG